MTSTNCNIQPSGRRGDATLSLAIPRVKPRVIVSANSLDTNKLARAERSRNTVLGAATSSSDVQPNSFTRAKHESVVTQSQSTTPQPSRRRLCVTKTKASLSPIAATLQSQKTQQQPASRRKSVSAHTQGGTASSMPSASGTCTTRRMTGGGGAGSAESRSHHGTVAVASNHSKTPKSNKHSGNSDVCGSTDEASSSAKIHSRSKIHRGSSVRKAEEATALNKSSESTTYTEPKGSSNQDTAHDFAMCHKETKHASQCSTSTVHDENNNSNSNTASHICGDTSHTYASEDVTSTVRLPYIQQLSSLSESLPVGALSSCTAMPTAVPPHRHSSAFDSSCTPQSLSSLSPLLLPSPAHTLDNPVQPSPLQQQCKHKLQEDFRRRSYNNLIRPDSVHHSHHTTRDGRSPKKSKHVVVSSNDNNNTSSDCHDKNRTKETRVRCVGSRLRSSFSRQSVVTVPDFVSTLQATRIESQPCERATSTNNSQASSQTSAEATSSLARFHSCTSSNTIYGLSATQPPPIRASFFAEVPFLSPLPMRTPGSPTEGLPASKTVSGTAGASSAFNSVDAAFMHVHNHSISSRSNSSSANNLSSHFMSSAHIAKSNTPPHRLMSLNLAHVSAQAPRPSSPSPAQSLFCSSSAEYESSSTPRWLTLTDQVPVDMKQSSCATPSDDVDEKKKRTNRKSAGLVVATSASSAATVGTAMRMATTDAAWLTETARGQASETAILGSAKEGNTSSRSNVRSSSSHTDDQTQHIHKTRSFSSQDSAIDMVREVPRRKLADVNHTKQKAKEDVQDCREDYANANGEAAEEDASSEDLEGEDDDDEVGNEEYNAEDEEDSDEEDSDEEDSDEEDDEEDDEEYEDENDEEDEETDEEESASDTDEEEEEDGVRQEQRTRRRMGGGADTRTAAIAQKSQRNRKSMSMTGVRVMTKVSREGDRNVKVIYITPSTRFSHYVAVIQHRFNYINGTDFDLYCIDETGDHVDIDVEDDFRRLTQPFWARLRETSEHVDENAKQDCHTHSHFADRGAAHASSNRSSKPNNSSGNSSHMCDKSYHDADPGKAAAMNQANKLSQRRVSGRVGKHGHSTKPSVGLHTNSRTGSSDAPVIVALSPTSINTPLAVTTSDDRSTATVIRLYVRHSYMHRTQSITATTTAPVAALSELGCATGAMRSEVESISSTNTVASVKKYASHRSHCLDSLTASNNTEAVSDAGSSSTNNMKNDNLQRIGSGSEFMRLNSGQRPISWTRMRVLGRGSYGVVYEAITSDGKMYAVKVQELPADEDAAATKAIMTEINLMRRLAHRHIVTYYGCQTRPTAASSSRSTTTTSVGEDPSDGRQLEIFMELCHGGSLTSLRRKFAQAHEHFSIALVRSYTRQILHGLSYLHSCQVLHRDIKSDNVLISALGEAKLADFGCGKQIGTIAVNGREAATISTAVHTSDATQEQTVTNQTLVGSPLFLAPEVMQCGGGYSMAADVWAAGCLVLEMLGCAPWSFTGNNVFQLIFQISRATTMPTGIPQNCPAVLLDFFHRCFDLDATKRASAAELLRHEWIVCPDDQLVEVRQSTQQQA